MTESPLSPASEGRRRGARRGRWLDLFVGIVLGIVLGVAIVAVFVFVFSEETVDAPRLERGGAPVDRPADR